MSVPVLGAVVGRELAATFRGFGSPAMTTLLSCPDMETFRHGALNREHYAESVMSLKRWQPEEVKPPMNMKCYVPNG